MRIRVKGYLTFRQLIGEQTLTFPDSAPPSLGDLLAQLCSQWDIEKRALVFDINAGALNQRVAVLVNGRHYTHISSGLETMLSDGDDISIFPPIAGGSD